MRLSVSLASFPVHSFEGGGWPRYEAKCIPSLVPSPLFRGGGGGGWVAWVRG